MQFDPTIILTLFQSFLLLKVAFLIILFLYIIFALVIVNQTRTMNGIIHENVLSTTLTIIALLHLFTAISLFVFALVIL